MFGFGKKKKVESVESQASKGYHSCVNTCEKDIENLDLECDNLRKDNGVLAGKLSTLQVSAKDHETTVTGLEDKVANLESQLSDRDELISELEKRLEDADEKADGTPVKYASARKALTKAKLKQLREALKAAPDHAGFGGSCSVYDKKTKRLSLVEFKSKADALAVLERAEKGHVDIIL